MKADIHPKYDTITITCSCGNVFETKSTLAASKDSIRVEVCSACHPQYTGKNKVIDTEGQLKKFMNKYAGLSVSGSSNSDSESKEKK